MSRRNRREVIEGEATEVEVERTRILRLPVVEPSGVNRLAMTGGCALAYKIGAFIGGWASPERSLCSRLNGTEERVKWRSISP